MTNKEHLDTLNAEDRKECESTYSREHHPLYDYIDWKAFWNSEDGNEMHFLNKLDEFTDIYGKKYAVLKKEIDAEEHIDYATVFCYDDSEILRCPINEGGSYGFNPELTQEDLHKCVANI